jgi:hypothetical protein
MHLSYGHFFSRWFKMNVGCQIAPVGWADYPRVWVVHSHFGAIGREGRAARVWIILPPFSSSVFFKLQQIATDWG